MTEALAVDGWVLVTDDYPEFARPVQEAESRFMQKLVDIAVKGAADDPKIALAILERKFPKEWARPTTLKFNTQSDGESTREKFFIFQSRLQSPAVRRGLQRMIDRANASDESDEKTAIQALTC